MQTPYRRLLLWEPLFVAVLAVLFGLLMITASPPAAKTDSLLFTFLSGPMRGVESVVFAARAVNPADGHWYDAEARKWARIA